MLSAQQQPQPQGTGDTERVMGTGSSRGASGASSPLASPALPDEEGGDRDQRSPPGRRVRRAEENRLRALCRLDQLDRLSGPPPIPAHVAMRRPLPRPAPRTGPRDGGRRRTHSAPAQLLADEAGSSSPQAEELPEYSFRKHKECSLDFSGEGLRDSPPTLDPRSSTDSGDSLRSLAERLTLQLEPLQQSTETERHTEPRAAPLRSPGTILLYAD